jgi:F0F1-type ATP synthase assembly protein I
MDTRTFDKKARQWVLINRAIIGRVIRVLLSFVVILIGWAMLYSGHDAATKTVQEVIQQEAARIAAWTVFLAILYKLISKI